MLCALMRLDCDTLDTNARRRAGRLRKFTPYYFTEDAEIAG